MDAVLGQTTVHGRRQKLRMMTEGLDLKNVYGSTLERIKELGGEKTRLGMAALMWVSHAERLLQLDELLNALAVEIGSTNLNAENIPSVEILLSCCLGLVIVDREASTIRLIHFTLQEYLFTCPDLFGPTHSIMAETCLTYLNFEAIKDISSARFIPPRPAPFLIYSSLYWGVHAKREAVRGVVPLALQLFGQIETHMSTKLLLIHQRSRFRFCENIPIADPLIGFTGLHCASLFGITKIATSLIEEPNCDLNKEDFLGITPLIWATVCGHEEVVKLLLERQTINPDKPDTRYHLTALSWAARLGHEGVVRLLLERTSAELDGTNGWWGKTSRVVNMARGRRYVDPNWTDTYRRTPVLWAAVEGHEGVVKLLLGRKDVEPDMQDYFGQTPLWSTAGKGHDGVIELLLGREDVNPNIQDIGGQTPLSRAAEGGHEGVVRLLLARGDVNPNIPDNGGRTPLSKAAEDGHEGVVKLLLERGDVDPNIPDNDGLVPLWWAAANSRDGVVELLQACKSANINPA